MIRQDSLLACPPRKGPRLRGTKYHHEHRRKQPYLPNLPKGKTRSIKYQTGNIYTVTGTCETQQHKEASCRLRKRKRDSNTHTMKPGLPSAGTSGNTGHNPTQWLPYTPISSPTRTLSTISGHPVKSTAETLKLRRLAPLRKSGTITTEN